MSKILVWIKKHVWQTVLIGFGLFLVPLIFVHIAYRIPAISPWFASTWEAGELITYIAGFEAFLGTVVLGLVAIRQNDKSNELNERMLNAEEKRDLFERQPTIDISNCSCEVVFKLDLYKKFSRNACIIYNQQSPIKITPDDNFNPKNVCFSFVLENLSDHPFTFSLSKVYGQNLSKKTLTKELQFNLRYCNSNTSCSLLPKQKQNLTFIANEDSFVDKDNYAIAFAFIFTNFIGETYFKDAKFLLTKLDGHTGDLSYIG